MSARKAGDTSAPKPQQWPAYEVERWPIDRPKPYAKNARTHSAAQVTQLVKLITEYGWTMPILCDEQDVMLAGHGRLLAAQQLGLTEVPVIVARGWTPAQKKAYRLADNQSAAMSGWDAELLRSEIGDLKAQAVNLELAGFTPNSLRSIFEPVRQRNVADGERYEVLILCESEEHQRELLERLTEEGLKCRALIA